MQGALTKPRPDAIRAENTIAMILSIFAPGLGQIYKGHLAEGFLWLFLGMPVAIWIGILLGLATAGVGLIIPLVCWGTLVLDAYWEHDRRTARHWFLSDRVDEDYSISLD